MGNICVFLITYKMFFLSSFDQLACLGQLRTLSELTLDGNPVALETWYKQAVLRCVLHLRQLDMKRITVRLLKFVCMFLQKDKLIIGQIMLIAVAAVTFCFCCPFGYFTLISGIYGEFCQGFLLSYYCHS